MNPELLKFVDHNDTQDVRKVSCPLCQGSLRARGLLSLGSAS